MRAYFAEPNAIKRDEIDISGTAPNVYAALHGTPSMKFVSDRPLADLPRHSRRIDAT
jgi:hypothetical protein